MSATQGRRRPRAAQADPDKVLASLKRMLNARQEWDEAPELGLIYAENNGRVTPSALNVPNALWQWANDPKNVLRGLTQLLRKPDSREAVLWGRALREAMPHDFVGIYMRNEAWAPPKGQAVEMFRRRMAGGSTPRFAEMEGRREMRLCAAVDAHGRRYLVSQPRDTMHLEGAFSVKSDGKDAIVTGDVPDLLDELLDELMVMPPETEAEDCRNGQL